MNKTETTKLLAVIAAAYPTFEVSELKVTVWQEMLGDLNYAAVQTAIKQTILTGKFAPSIAEVRQAAIDLMHPDILSSAEAWGMVINAIHQYGSWRQSEALASLPPEVAETAKQMGWQEMCRAEKVEVVRGQFIKLYEQLQQRANAERLLPHNLKQQIASSRNLQITGGVDHAKG